MNTESKNPHAVGLGKLGAAKGGRARARELSAERREEIARQAARTRWHPGEPARPDIQSKPAAREDSNEEELIQILADNLHQSNLRIVARRIIAAGWRKGEQ